jgi:hypothetical protein
VCLPVLRGDNCCILGKEEHSKRVDADAAATLCMEACHARACNGAGSWRSTVSRPWGAEHLFFVPVP